MKEIISTNKAPSAIGPYNQGTSFEKLVFLSGQIPLDPETMELVGGDDIQAQTKQVMENLKAVLQEANSSFENVLKTTCYLSDMDNFVAFNEVYAQYFQAQTAPARATVAVKTLPKNVLVEVDVIAFKN
ncbi:endoribonuclease L-PSP [Malaciobacter pacificus]|jgi:2-iminobutanoate/2-iminopropanoate deaminase|uniref:Reactive intermediate/imine deaminase n=1 Tax=Malaciobacter pacificus TaxID=1080223 RepID=A0A5C2HCI6_9BACT|nr:RidA family protein [Malaciobacter pacificus]QEP35275.1 reactive intermediate/imine deaminase [Malaciobacter pacificus]GGD44038.1 endoribonuclease L-PSP [Malaciobacter pacificus]